MENKNLHNKTKWLVRVCLCLLVTGVAAAADSAGQSKTNISGQFQNAPQMEPPDSVKKEIVRGFARLKIDAEKGDAMAQYRLGLCYAWGQGVSKDNVEAAKWFRKSAEQNDHEAQCALGSCYLNGDGVTKDIGEGVKWYRVAAEQGDVHAMQTLGICYRFGFFGVTKNDAEAKKWFRLAADTSRQAAERGDARSENLLGEAYRDGEGVAQDDKEAFNWFSNAAKHGNVDGERNIALAYRDGAGVTKADVEAVKWLRKSAKQGDVQAQFNLGLMYELGRGVPQNSNEAMNWFQKSKDWLFSQEIIEAYKGGIKEQTLLGRYFFDGSLGIKDHAEAAKWYRMAAEQGNRTSQVRLASMYEDGDGVASILSTNDGSVFIAPSLAVHTWK